MKLLLIQCFFLSFTLGKTLSNLENDIHKRIVGGTEVKKMGKWPFLVSMQGKIPTKTVFGIPLPFPTKQWYCGGSVINKRWILTAAHCFDGDNRKLTRKAKYWEARLAAIKLKPGVSDYLMHAIGKIIDKKDWQQYNIDAEKIIIHPGYDAESSWLNDIALMKLEKDVPAGEEVARIKKIKLPNQGNSSFPKDNKECMMIGWGCNSAGGSVSKSAYEVSLPIMNSRRCGAAYLVSNMNKRICAGVFASDGSKIKGICPGDSGGPLVCASNNKWVQVGIASFTSTTPGRHPGAFTRVSEYVDWINNVIRNN